MKLPSLLSQTTSRQYDDISGPHKLQWPVAYMEPPKNLIFFLNVMPYRMTQQPPVFQRIWWLRNVGRYTSYNTVSNLGRPNNARVSLKYRNFQITCKTGKFVLDKAKGWTEQGSKPCRRRVSHPQICPGQLWYPHSCHFKR